MNQGAVLKIGIAVAAILFTLFLIISILTSGGNQIGELLKWFVLIGPIFGFAAPKSALLCFFVIQFYLDFLKRLMVIGDSLSMNDVIVSLGFGPALVVAACASCFLGAIGGRYSMKGMDILLFIGAFLVSFLGISTVNSYSMVDIGQAILGSAMIGMTAFATSVLLREKEDAATFFKVILISAIPMGLYTIWQRYVGLSFWEIDYIEKGYSAVLYTHYLNHLREGVPMRPFSTLNLHVSLGAVSGALTCVGLFIMAQSSYFLKGMKRISLGYFLLGAFYAAICIWSTNRTTFFLPPMALIMIWFFQSGLRTIIFYIGSLALFLTIVLNAEEINANLLAWDASFRATAFGQTFGTIGTYTDRLQGFMVLGDLSNWRPFGFPAELKPFTHDPVTAILVSIGYVPLILCLCFLTAWLMFWHKSILAIRDTQERWLAIRLTAVIAALGICGLAYGNVIFVSPVNSLMGVLIAMAFCAIRRDRVALSASPTTAVQ